MFSPNRYVYPLAMLLALATVVGCGPDENNTPGEDMASGMDQGMTPEDMGAADDGGEVDMGSPADDGGEVDMNMTVDDGGEVDMNMGPGACSSAGPACDPAATHDDGFVCVPRGDQNVCRAACTPGEMSDCGAQEACVALDENTNYCQPNECSDFFSNDCRDGFRCVPVTPNINTCIPIGAGVEGDNCTANADCGEEMVCIPTGETDPMTNEPIAQCAVIGCGPLTNAPTCPNANDICTPLNIGGEPVNLGLCQATCPLFDDPAMHGCEPNQVCAPGSFPVMRNGDGELFGFCANPNGNFGQKGESCDENTGCADGLICVGGECRPSCDPQAAEGAAGRCDETDGQQLCQTLQAGDPPTSIGIGACFDSCTPYTGVDKTGEGCEMGEWCFPNLDFANDGFGQCTGDSGMGVEGDACDENTLCQPGLLCISGECRVLCDPDAMPGAPGATDDVCPRMNDACNGLSQTDDMGNSTPLNLGICQESCGYDEGMPMCSQGLSCVPQEITGGSVDTCGDLPNPEIELLGDCTAAGLSQGQLCGPNSACLDLSQSGGPPGLVCYDLCRTNQGAFNTTNHPDCRSSSATCAEVFQSTEFGLCTPQ